MTEDLQLVRDVLKGNVESFDRIIYKYEAPVYRFVLGMVKDPEVSKDIVQEAFINAYNKLYTYREQYKFSNWLYQIARNKCIDYLRKNKKAAVMNIEYAFEVASGEMMPEEILEFKETKDELKNFMKSLDYVDRQILILKGLNEDMRFIDIAETLQMSDSTVKSRYYKLFEKYKSFKKKMEKRCVI